MSHAPDLRALLTDIERTDDAAWCHFRAPDGTVLEIIGPRPTGH